MSSKREDKRNDMRRHIVRKGIHALYRKGYNATGVNEIVQAADIPKGSFYNYFKSKEDFAIACMQYFTARELDIMQSVLFNQEQAPLDRIRTLYQNKVSYLSETRQFSMGCLLSNITLEMADNSEIIAAEAMLSFKKEYQPLIDCLIEAQTNGDISADSNVTQVAYLIRNCWLGALVIMKAEKSADPLQEFLEQLEFIFKTTQ